MAFKWKRNLSGGTTPTYDEYPQGNVAITKQSIVYWSSGYIIDTTVGSIYTSVVAGICDRTIDNSGGSDGDYDMPVVVNRDAVYLVDTTGTPAQTQCGTSVTIETALTIDEDDAQTDKSGVFNILKLINATGKLVEGVINYAPPADA